MFICFRCIPLLSAKKDPSGMEKRFLRFFQLFLNLFYWLSRLCVFLQLRQFFMDLIEFPDRHITLIRSNFRPGYRLSAAKTSAPPHMAFPVSSCRITCGEVFSATISHGILPSTS